MMAKKAEASPRYADPQLAQREKEILLAWIRSDSKDEVVRQLMISPGTVNTVLTRIRAKYAHVGRPATNKAALVARALQDGLLTLDEL